MRSRPLLRSHARCNARADRYCLNLKKIPYKTEWIEYPDIAAHCAKLGFSPSATRVTRGTGTLFYTLPAIHDTATGVHLCDSSRIAEYLEAQYPACPRIFPHDTIGLQIDFHDRMSAKLSALWDFVVPAMLARLVPASQAYYRRTREAAWGVPIEKIAPAGGRFVEEWDKVRAGFAQVAGWYAKMRAEGPFIMGAQASWADFVVGAHLVWLNKAWGEDDPKWKAIMQWDNGAWKALFDALKEYGASD